MPQEFAPGDFLVFQLEAGFALVRILAVDTTEAGPVWHLAAYSEFFPDVETAEAATAAPHNLPVGSPHLVLTNRAFESTQVAKIGSSPLTSDELVHVEKWRIGQDQEVSDRSVRLMLGLR